jgi:4-hydroxyphenylacetate 3-monooxygenase
MPARTGRQFIEGLRAQEREVWLGGERVRDVTTHPGLAGGAHAIASLYDMQCEPELRDEMTYVSPSSGERVGLSFIIPRTREDLARRRQMMLNWARATGGMMGRSPDFMNVTYAAWAGAADFFGQGGRPEFAENMRRYYEYLRENDICLTHALINLQRSRTASGAFNLQPGTALEVVRETDAGIVVRGARILATLGPLADEIGVYSPRLGHTENHSPFALSFAIPCGTSGLKFLCRDSFDEGRSHFDRPLSSRFEEMDCIVFFDDVLVPWERVFLLGDAARLNATFQATGSIVHSGHQGTVKNLAKCEFVLGTALLMAQALGNGHLPHVEERIGELMLTTQLTRACLCAAEADAERDEWGVMRPDPLMAEIPRNLFMNAYPRMIEILQLLGSSSFMLTPSEKDFAGPLKDHIAQYLATDTTPARDRVKLFRLAWDLAGTSFGSRQVLYERFFASDPLTRARALAAIYPKGEVMGRVQRFLARDDDNP